MLRCRFTEPHITSQPGATCHPKTRCPNQVRLLLWALLAVHLTAVASDDEGIDASDPTKIYSYVGPGYKHTSFTNDDTLNELRIIGNLGLGANDMVLFELGYGKYSGTVEESDDERGVTNGRARYFHLFAMDYSKISGYRGWATQVDFQFEGNVKGTRGANILALGGLPAFGISESWSFYLPVNYVSNWGEGFAEHKGHGASIAPMAAYAPAKGLWRGFFLQIWPSYTRYFAGDLSGEGGANIDLTVGGSPSAMTVITATLQQNFDKNLALYSLTPGSAAGGNDWNLFVSCSFYF